jgi:hypothetical protein
MLICIVLYHHQTPARRVRLGGGRKERTRWCVERRGWSLLLGHLGVGNCPKKRRVDGKEEGRVRDRLEFKPLEGKGHYYS